MPTPVAAAPLPALRPAARRARRTRALGLALGLALALPACEVSEDEEVALGRQTAEQIAAQLPLVQDPAVTGYLTDLGLQLARRTGRPELDWRFHVVNSDEVNAFAVPGGFVYVNRGLIERAATLSQLAGVLGHEVGHVALRHSAEQMESQNRTSAGVGIVCALTGWCESGAAQVAIQVAGSAWFARHSREDEVEADSLAVETLVRAGYDPDGVPDMFERLMAERARAPLGVEQWFSSHPLEESRVAATRAHVASLDPASLEGLVQDDEAFQQFKRRVAELPPPPPPPRQLQ
jgi:predicted Zn-dependent protease